MKRLSLLVVLGLLVIFHCRRVPKLDENTVAIVGDHAISFGEYRERYADYLAVTYQQDNLRLRLGVVNNMINELLLREYDDNSAIFEDPQYEIEKQRALDEIVLAFLKEKEIYAAIKITDAEARQAFKRLNERIAARHLYAANEQEAERLYLLLQKGASFDSLAREVFTDSTLKSNGGYLGYFTLGDMDPAFEDMAYRLKPGEISPPVKTAHGYSIIKVEDRKQVPILTENEYRNKKGQIIRFLKLAKRKEAEKQFLQEHFDWDSFVFEKQGLQELMKAINPQGESAPADQSRSVVRFQGRTYSVAELLEEFRHIPAYHKARIRDLDDLQAVIKGRIINRELLKMAQRQGLYRSPVLQKGLANARNNLFLKFKRAYIVRRSVVADSLLRVYYRKNVWKFKTPRRLNVREILVGDRQTARNLKKRLLQGEDFATLAQAYSLRRQTAQRGGLTGYADWQRFGQLKEKFWQAPLGKILGPWPIGALYGLFRVEGKKEAEPQPFEQVKDQVRDEYKGENQTELVRAHLDSLRARVHIQRNDKLIRSFVLKDK